MVRHVYTDCLGATGFSALLHVATGFGPVTATRFAPRRYAFNGKVTGVEGKVLSLYRAPRGRDGVIGAPVLTAQTRIGGPFWSIERTFTGTGEFMFWISAGEDINSLGGGSPSRLTVIH